jgi:hypothetical protein
MAHMGCATIATPLVAFENSKNSKKNHFFKIIKIEIM